MVENLSKFPQELEEMKPELKREWTSLTRWPETLTLMNYIWQSLKFVLYCSLIALKWSKKLVDAALGLKNESLIAFSQKSAGITGFIQPQYCVCKRPQDRIQRLQSN